MENATKALLIAAGVLLAVMLLSLLFVFRSNLSGYYTGKHDATMTEQLVEFNNKFQNYAGKTIRGNELVSIMNMIVDYNNYRSKIEGYDRIIIEINFNGHHNELKYRDESISETLISNSRITNQDNDIIIEKIAETSSRLTSNTNIRGVTITDTKLQKLSSNIANIVACPTSPQVAQNDYKEYRAQILTKILGKKYEANDDVNDIINATYQYYQFTQFKRAMFKCSEINYSESNGRIKLMKFEVVLENNKIKFD